MRLRELMMLLALLVVACGETATDSTAATGVQAAANDMSGLSLEVHQAPG